MNPLFDNGLYRCPKCLKQGRFEYHGTAEEEPEYELLAEYSVECKHPDGSTCELDVVTGIDQVEWAINEFRDG